MLASSDTSTNTVVFSLHSKPTGAEGSGMVGKKEARASTYHFPYDWFWVSSWEIEGL